MKLVKMRNDQKITVYCQECHKRTMVAYADLDGKAFESYYCLECAKEALERASKYLTEETDHLF